MRKLWMLMVIASAGVSLAADNMGLEREDVRRNRWHLTIGPVMAPRVRTKINAPQRALPTPASLISSTSGTAPVAAAPTAGFVPRTYVDGHVNPDAGTTAPASVTAGLTWDWSASNVGAQHNATAGTIEFRTGMERWTQNVTAAAYGGGPSGERDRDVLLGVEAMGGFTFFEDDTFDVALDGGFRYYGSSGQKLGTMDGVTATTTRNEFRYVDSYDASGWTAPYPTGSYTGTPGGPGRIIGATPTRTGEELMSTTTTTADYFCGTHTKLNYRIWDLRMGPTVGWHVTDWFAIRGGMYGLLGLVDAKLRTEVATETGSYSAKKTKCAPVFGIASSLSAKIDLTDHIYFLAGVEYDWWTNAVRLRAADARAKLRLSDFTVTLAMGLEF